LQSSGLSILQSFNFKSFETSILSSLSFLINSQTRFISSKNVGFLLILHFLSSSFSLSSFLSSSFEHLSGFCNLFSQNGLHFLNLGLILSELQKLLKKHLD
jgi:hypothetical protein